MDANKSGSNSGNHVPAVLEDNAALLLLLAIVIAVDGVVINPKIKESRA